MEFPGPFAILPLMEAAVLEREALRLTTAERALLADRLLQTLGCEDASVMAAWAAEAERRFEAYKRGEIQAVDGPLAMERIRRTLA